MPRMRPPRSASATVLGFGEYEGVSSLSNMFRGTMSQRYACLIAWRSRQNAPWREQSVGSDAAQVSTVYADSLVSLMWPSAGMM